MPSHHDGPVQYLYDTAAFTTQTSPRLLNCPFSTKPSRSRMVQMARRVSLASLFGLPWVLLPWSTSRQNPMSKVVEANEMLVRSGLVDNRMCLPDRHSIRVTPARCRAFLSAAHSSSASFAPVYLVPLFESLTLPYVLAAQS